MTFSLTKLWRSAIFVLPNVDLSYRACQRSAETKKPVRVIRGFKSKAKYAPTEGYVVTLVMACFRAYSQIRYRYDGLYTVEKVFPPLECVFQLFMRSQAWVEKGLNTKYLVCKFAFKVSRHLKFSNYPTTNLTLEYCSGSQDSLPCLWEESVMKRPHQYSSMRLKEPRPIVYYLPTQKLLHDSTTLLLAFCNNA